MQSKAAKRPVVPVQLNLSVAIDSHDGLKAACDGVYCRQSVLHTVCTADGVPHSANSISISGR